MPDEIKRYGVFVWRAAGPYRVVDAVRVFKTERGARTFCERRSDKEYVIRAVWVDATTGEDRS